MAAATVGREGDDDPGLRIAIVETAAYGGLLHYAFQFADGLARYGDDVDLIVPRDHELDGNRTAARQLEVLPAPLSPGAPPATTPLRRLRRRAGVAIRLTAAWARIVATVRRGSYDVVLLTCDLGVVPAALGATLLTTLPGAPPVANVCHNARIFNRGSGSSVVTTAGLAERLVGRVLRRCAVVFVHGERTRSELEATRGSLRTAVIPHGDESVFAELPPPPGGEERALFFGNWTRYKGLDDLMSAFDLVAARRPAARLTIAGEPSSQEVDVAAIRAWAAARSQSVEIVERYVPVPEVRELFARSQVLVAPYVLGYQSGAIHLAMTMGRAVVTTDVGDLGAAVLDGETGFVVPPSEPAAFAAALERVLADPVLARRLGAEGRRRVEAHSSWEEVARLAHDQLAAASRTGSRAAEGHT